MLKNCRAGSPWTFAVLVCAALFLSASADESRAPLPDPDGRPANMGLPVQVYILLGQSNMLGFGKINGGNGSLTHAVKEEALYPYLVDDAGNWTVRKDVRNVRVMVGRGGMQVFNNEWMTIDGKNIGPEIGIGHHLGNATDAPVLILKSCIGNRSLGWDLLPPGSERFEFGGKMYAGYKDSPASWPKGTEPKPVGWYAGKQYDDDTANAKKVLADLQRYYPGARRYEIAGFFFWQGAKDCGDAAHSARYEQNLVRFIEQLRKDFNAPKAKFVCATLGHVKKGSGGNNGKVLDAQLAVDGKNGKYRQFRGNVASVYANPFCHGGSANGHYGGNAKTYMDVGEAMGRAMVGLVGSESSLARLSKHLDADSRRVYKALEKQKYAAAWEALKKFKAAHDAKVKEGKLSEDAIEAQKKLLISLKQEIGWPLGQAIKEIESLRESGDVYRLSVVFRDHDKAFKGIKKFDSTVGAIAKELRDPEIRAAVSAGKKFYALIDKIKATESKRKGPRTAAGIKSIATYLNRFAKREDDSIYGKAAAIAAEKVGDPDHVVRPAAAYIRLAKTGD